MRASELVALTERRNGVRRVVVDVRDLNRLVSLWKDTGP